MRAKVAALSVAAVMAFGGVAAAPAQASHTPVHTCTQVVSRAIVEVFGSKQNLVNLINSEIGVPLLNVSTLNQLIRRVCQQQVG